LGRYNHFANTQIRPLFTSFVFSRTICGFWKANTKTHEVSTERGERAGLLENQYRLFFCCEVPTSLSKTAASSSCFRFDKFSFVPPQIPLGFFHFEDDSLHRVAWRSNLSIAAKAIFTANFRRDGSIKLQYIYNVKKSIRQGVKCYLKSNFLTATSKIFWDVYADRYFGYWLKKVGVSVSETSIENNSFRGPRIAHSWVPVCLSFKIEWNELCIFIIISIVWYKDSLCREPRQSANSNLVYWLRISSNWRHEVTGFWFHVKIGHLGGSGFGNSVKGYLPIHFFSV